MNRRFACLLPVIFGAIAVLVIAPPVQADVLTFNVAPNTEFGPGPTFTEGIFTYDAFSGVLLMNDLSSDGSDMEGSASGGGGVLRILRNDLAGGLFTFDSSEVAQFLAIQPVNITFTGLRGGIVQGIDTVTAPADTGIFSSASAANLSGVLIDELRIDLPGYLRSRTEVWGAIDNVNLSSFSGVAAPEPGSVALTLFGLVTAGGHLRRRSKSNR